MQSKFGIIGYPLSTTFSPAYFTNKFAVLGVDATYSSYPLASINEFPALLLSNPGMAGLSVTIPHKETVIPFLDEIDEVARQIGAVNSIKINKGKTTGYNTDVFGFEQSLKPLLKARHTHALILGSGGASKAVAYVLRKLGISYCFVSRGKKSPLPLLEGTKANLDYEHLSDRDIADNLLIINTTPLGMFPDIHLSPLLPYQAITKQHLLYDLIYSPDQTQFLSLGKQQGATVKNGLEMLQLQADRSWEIWNE